MTAQYLPGDHWLVVTGSATAFLDGSAPDALRVWQVMSGGGRAEELLDAVVGSGMRGSDGSVARLGAFLLAVAEPGGLRVLCRGVDQVTVETDDGHDVAVTADGLVSWMEMLIPQARTLMIGAADPADLLPAPGGVVRAAAARWRPVASAEQTGGLSVSGAAGDEAAGAALPAADEQPTGDLVPAEQAPDFSHLPPLPEPAPLPPLPPFVPAPAVLPAIAGDQAARWVEETRVDVDIDPDDPDDSTPSGPAAEPRSVAPQLISGLHSRLENAPGMASPASDASETEPDLAGDHDGMTQLAEDLPIGYTPPPMPAEPPPGTVLAVLCPAGHANAPHSSTCRLCGQPITNTEPVPVPQPVLARIRLSFGDVVELDRPVVLGRAPYASRVAASQLPRLVTVPSPNQDISRAHAQIRTADWHLVVADLDSTNGTTVRPPGRAPLRLHPGQEIVVEPGWSVELGDGVSFVIEALA